MKLLRSLDLWAAAPNIDALKSLRPLADLGLRKLFDLKIVRLLTLGTLAAFAALTQLQKSLCLSGCDSINDISCMSL
jgi:hypothetical protein